MTGERENSGSCYFCRGRLKEGKATVPFVLQGSVIVVKRVPAEICKQCGEPFMGGEVVDKIMELLDRFEPFRAEVLVVSYEEEQPALPGPAATTTGAAS